MSPRAAASPRFEYAEMSVADLRSGRMPGNPRVMPEHEAEALRGSITKFGLVEPIVWNRRTKHVVGGHMRIDALVALGRKRARVVIVDLDDHDEKALSLALNKIHGEWDWPKLQSLLDELAKIDSTLPAVAGFTDTELNRLLDDGHLLGMRVEQARAELAALEEDEANARGDGRSADEPAPKAVGAPISRPGDLWILGPHRLLCGDSTNPEHVARVMGGEKAVLLSTDPPYCVDYTGDNRPVHKGKRTGKDWSALYHEVEIKDLGEFLDRVMKAVVPHLDAGAPIYVWHAHVQQPVIAQVFEKHEILFHQVIVWVKPNGVFGHSYFQWRHEPCAFGWRRGSKPKHGEKQLDTVWEVDWEGKSKVVGNEHPTQKPVRLFELPMRLHTERDAIILEPFSGSGSQLIAAEKRMRRFRGLEISPVFVDAAIRRWQVFSGDEATLEGDGRTFAQVAALRRKPDAKAANA